MTVTPLFFPWKPATQAAIAAVCALDPDPLKVPDNAAVPDPVLGELLPTPAAALDTAPDGALDVTPAAALPAAPADALGLAVSLAAEHAPSPTVTASTTGIAAR